MSDLTSTDLSVIVLYLSKRINRKIDETMSAAREVVRNILGKWLNAAKSTVNIDDDLQTFSDWCYCYEKGWFIEWGFCSPETSDVWGSTGLPSYPQVFIRISSDKKETIPLFEIPEDRRPSSWNWITMFNGRPTCTRIQNFSEIAASSSGFTQAFIEWLNTGIPEAVTILDDAHSIYLANKSAKKR